jgi:hypothetical protein
LELCRLSANLESRTRDIRYFCSYGYAGKSKRCSEKLRDHVSLSRDKLSGLELPERRGLKINYEKSHTIAEGYKGVACNIIGKLRIWISSARVRTLIEMTAFHLELRVRYKMEDQPYHQISGVIFILRPATERPFLRMIIILAKSFLKGYG